MRKMMNKLSMVLLSVILTLSLAAPASAAGVKAGKVNLYVRAEAEDVTKPGIQVNLYRIAVWNAETGRYELTEAYRALDTEGELRALLDELNGKLGEEKGVAYLEPEGDKPLLTYDSALMERVIKAFGGYINRTVNNGDESPRYASEKTAEADGHLVAAFENIDEGLYLVASNTRYVASGVNDSANDYVYYYFAPFVIEAPFTYAGVTNNHITAAMKYWTENTYVPYVPNDPPTPSDNPDDPPTPPDNPDEPPTPPDNPDAPDTPDDVTDIPDEETPLAEPEIELLPEDVPLSDLPDDIEPEIEIPDEDVPLAELPQTGLLWWPVPALAAAGLALVGVGLAKRKRGSDK